MPPATGSAKLIRSELLLGLRIDPKNTKILAAVRENGISILMNFAYLS